jgi:cytochrome c5
MINPKYVAPLVAFGIAVGIATVAKTVKPAPGREGAVSLDLTRPADAGRGAKLYDTSCATCHGTSGRGLPHQGANLQNSRYMESADDRKLIAFLRAGRTPDSPESIMRLYMPAKGGVATFSDNDLQDIVAHMRKFQKPAQPKPAEQKTTDNRVAMLR